MSRSRAAVFSLALSALVAAPCLAWGQSATQPAIDPIDPGELAAVRPLLARGPVLLPRQIDWGADARSTVYLTVRAPADTVFRVITTPEQYPSFIPALAGVDVLSRRDRRAAFRFRADAVVFDVTADAMLHAVNPRRVDFTITRSEFGPSRARWEIFPDGPGQTTVALTVWTDPGRAGWAVRQLAGNSSFGPSSVNMTVECVLALAVKRRAEMLSGARLPLRPSRAALAPARLLPPLPPGPWLSLSRDVHVVNLSLDPSGAIVQATAAAWTQAEPARITRRLLEPEHYHDFWNWMGSVRVLARTPNSVRFRASLEAPLGAGSGEFVTTVDPSGRVVTMDGVAGDFAREHHRWDIMAVPNEGTYAVYTSSGSAVLHAPLLHRALIDRDPWTAVGMSGYWQAVTARFGLWNLLPH